MSGGSLGNTDPRSRTVLGVFRTLALGLAAAILTAGSCKDNLGKSGPGPVTFRVSVGTNNLQANGASTSPRPCATSSDGRFVVFESTATNLSIPSAPVTEVFVRDRLNDVVENISQLGRFNSKFLGGVTLKDAHFPAISPDGRYVAFTTMNVLVGTESTPQTTENIFFFDRDTGLMSRVLPTTWPDHDMLIPSIGITAAGRPLVAFHSQSTNLGFVTAGTTNQVYVADMSLVTPTITLVSRDSVTPTTIANQSATVGQISADGTTVSFISQASNLGFGVLSRNEAFVGTLGVSVTVDLISRASGTSGVISNGDCYPPALSADGRFAAFVTTASNLTPNPPTFSIVVRDRNVAAPLTTLAASDPDGFPVFIIIIFDTVSISGDGRFVAYHSSTDSQIYVRDMQGGATLVSRSTAGAVSNNTVPLTTPVISGDGRWVFWNSDADNLVTDDTNGVQDVFGRGQLQ